jgi:serine/threonine protein kinase
MGEVYRAHDVRLGRDVAVKILPMSVARDTDRLGRFEREARAIAALSHPNIVAVFDTGTGQPFGSPGDAAMAEGDAPTVTYVVMELLTGETLASRLAQGPVAPRKATEPDASPADCRPRTTRASCTATSSPTTSS